MKRRFPKGGIRKNAQEYVDADYLNKLTKDEREWYDNFILAEYSANMIAAEKIKGKPLTKKERQDLDRGTYVRRHDAHTRINRSTTANRALANSEKPDETQGQTFEEREE